MSRKEWGRGLSSIDDYMDASIREFNDDIKKAKKGYLHMYKPESIKRMGRKKFPGISKYEKSLNLGQKSRESAD